MKGSGISSAATFDTDWANLVTISDGGVIRVRSASELSVGNQPEWKIARLQGHLLSGASRTRTGDLLGAIQALSQLSYSPGHARAAVAGGTGPW